MKPRGVTVYSLRHPDQVRDDGNGEGQVESITLAAHVSKGTYIRSLARDIAYALGTVGHVAMLRRTKAGPFTLDHAISLDNLNAFGQGAAQSDVILPLEAGLVDIPAPDPTGRAFVRGRGWQYV